MGILSRFFLLFAALALIAPELPAATPGGGGYRKSAKSRTKAKRATSRHLAQAPQLSTAPRGLLAAPKPRPWALQGELLGRGGFYSLNLEYAPMRAFAFGAGFSYQSVSAMSVTADIVTLPLYANYYPTSHPVHRLFASGGVTILSVQGKSDDIQMKAEAGGQEANVLIRGLDLVSATLPIPNFGGGYEFAHRGGFLFRGQLLLFYTGEITPTFGLAAGYRF